MINLSDGIWDESDWISWDEINDAIEYAELKAEYPHGSSEQIRIFETLVETAVDYKRETGRYLQIWGELGEFYAEIKYGVKRHRPGTPGSDGRIGNDWVEVKTISPEKGTEKVSVKRAGNFNKILVVRIDEDFQFAAKLLDRRVIGKGEGKNARVSWASSDD